MEKRKEHRPFSIGSIACFWISMACLLAAMLLGFLEFEVVSYCLIGGAFFLFVASAILAISWDKFEDEGPTRLPH